jgi:hypothetical protein
MASTTVGVACLIASKDHPTTKKALDSEDWASKIHVSSPVVGIYESQPLLYGYSLA